MKLLASFISWLELINERVGRAVSWLMIGVVLVTFSVAILRYVFNMGWVWMQESYVWMHATIFLVASGYTLLHDGHVRIDIFYREASSRYKAWVNLWGTLLLLVPTIGVIYWVTLPYVLLSWHRFEQSREAGGMKGLFIFKTTMIVFVVLLALQCLVMLLRSVLVLLGHSKFEKKKEEIEESI